jgi:hypothetical protein
MKVHRYESGLKIKDENWRKITQNRFVEMHATIPFEICGVEGTGKIDFPKFVEFWEWKKKTKLVLHSIAVIRMPFAFH